MEVHFDSLTGKTRRSLMGEVAEPVHTYGVAF